MIDDPTAHGPSADEPSPGPSGAPGRGERGATFVEYALLVALLAVPTIGAIDLMHDGAKTKVQTTATGISTHTIPVVTTTTAAGGATTTTTVAPTTAAPTTAAPTTTTTSTTTTVKPTTTTTAPTTTTTAKPTTTTTKAPTSSATTWGTASTSTSGSGNNKTWKASASMTVKDNYGQVVSGATVVVRVTYVDKNGNTQTVSPDLTDTTDASGAVSFTSASYATSTSKSSYASSLTFTIVSVTKSGLTWNGSNKTVTAAKP